MKTINDRIIKHSVTNPQIIKNKLLNKYNINNGFFVEFENKQLAEDSNKLNRYLCILYTTYQFCINEFYECLITVLNMLNNYFINYEEFCDIKLLGKNMKKIRENLISKIAFTDNVVLTNLYSSAKKKPSLLKGVFDFDNFLVSYKESEKNSANSFEESIDLGEFLVTNDNNKSVSNKYKNKSKEKKIIKNLKLFSVFVKNVIK